MQEGASVSPRPRAPTDYSHPATLAKIVAVLFTPFIFAYLLKPVGMYSAAPVFIALIIWLFGERRWKWILGITLLICSARGLSSWC